MSRLLKSCSQAILVEMKMRTLHGISDNRWIRLKLAKKTAIPLLFVSLRDDFNDLVNIFVLRVFQVADLDVQRVFKMVDG